MRHTPILAAVLITSALPAHADDCRARFIDNRMAYLAAPLPGIGRIVSETKVQKTENEYHSAAWDHGLFKPASLPWTLTYTGAMYNSTNQGATWEKAHCFEAKKQRGQNIQTVKEQLASATNIVCGEDTIDGIVYDTFESDMENHEYAHYTMHDKYWVDRKTGYVVKSTMLPK